MENEMQYFSPIQPEDLAPPKEGLSPIQTYDLLLMQNAIIVPKGTKVECIGCGRKVYTLVNVLLPRGCYFHCDKCEEEYGPSF